MSRGGRDGVTHDPKGMSVDERNHRMLERHEVYCRQQFYAGSLVVLGGHGDLRFDAVNATNKRILGFSSLPDRINDDLEVEVGTAGHAFFLMPEQVDDLKVWCERIIAARKPLTDDMKREVMMRP